jgi:uncharacterized protein
VRDINYYTLQLVSTIKGNALGTIRQPVYFCTQCGNCCRWPGYVHISDHDVEAISDYLDMSADAFIDGYTRLTADRKGLSLTEKKDGSCVFLDDESNQCEIYPVKPKQCIDFPQHWNFKGWKSQCPIIEFKVKLKKATSVEKQKHCYVTSARSILRETT